MASVEESIPRNIPVLESKMDLNYNEERESIIKNFLEAYKNYIVKCISYEELLFYKYFSPEKRKYFRRRAKAEDCVCITSEMIETITEMEDVPDRFSSLVKLFKDEFENEKVQRILTGQNEPTHRKEHIENIQRVCTKLICENLCITEIIPELIKYGLISQNEGESIRKKAGNESSFSASLDLVLILPNRHPNWYGRFIACLIKSGHQQLAEAVDKGFCERILKNKKVDKILSGETPSDYEDEMMSLVSGPMKKMTPAQLLMKHRSEKRCMAKPSSLVVKDDPSGQEMQAETEETVGNQKAISPGDQRVSKWLLNNESIVSDTAMEEEESEDGSFESKKHKVCAERTQSFSIVSSSAKQHRAMFKRHPTSLDRSQKNKRLRRFSKQNCVEKNSAKQRLHTLRYTSSHKSSVVSNVSSNGHYSVDSWEVHISISQTDAASVALSTNTAAISGEILRNEEIRSGGAENTAKSSDSQSANNVSDNNTYAKGQKTFSCYPILKQLFDVSCLHPVKIVIAYKEHPELKTTCNLLARMSYGEMKNQDYILALKTHYISTVIQCAKDAEDIDMLIDSLLTGTKTDGNYEFQDNLIRKMLNKFTYTDSEIHKTLLSKLHAVPLGDGLSSLKVLIDGLAGKSSFVGKTLTRTTRNNDADEVKSHSCIEALPDIGLSELASCGTGIRNCLTDESSMQFSSEVSIETVLSSDNVYRFIKDDMAKVSYKVTGIQMIQNESLLTTFMRKKDVLMAENGGKANEGLMFHDSQFIQDAIENGFQTLNTNQTIEQELYFSEKPLQYEIRLEKNKSFYVPRSCSTHRCTKRMLICRVCLGKIAHGLGHSTDRNISEKCHSIKTSHQYNGKEYFTYSVISGDQIYPKYLVTYKMDHTETKQ